MVASQLILTEGIPGMGKSTTSQFIALNDFRFPRCQLIPIGPGLFQVETLGYDLTFSFSSEGVVGSFSVAGKEPGLWSSDFTLLGRTYRKV